MRYGDKTFLARLTKSFVHPSDTSWTGAGIDSRDARLLCSQLIIVDDKLIIAAFTAICPCLLLNLVISIF
jgi:hypothetical protein